MYFKYHGKLVVEIKSPSSIKNKKISEGDSNCEFLSFQEGKIVLKQNQKILYQINSKIVLPSSSEGYFVVWTNKDILIDRTEFDRNLWNSVSQALEMFFKSYVIERILGINPIDFCGSCEKVLYEES